MNQKIGVSLLLAACTTVSFQNARLYDLSTGSVSTAVFSFDRSGSGTIELDLEDGTQCDGEYVTSLEGTSGWGMIYAAGRIGMVTTTERPNQLRGSAVVTCSDGTVIECEYLTISQGAQGSGACQDNSGTHYRLMF